MSWVVRVSAPSGVVLISMITCGRWCGGRLRYTHLDVRDATTGACRVEKAGGSGRFWRILADSGGAAMVGNPASHTRHDIENDDEAYCDKMCNLMLGTICIFVFMGGLLLLTAHLLNERGGNSSPVHS